MTRYFVMGGPIMWPLLVLAVVILVVAGANAVRLFARRETGPADRSSVNAILFWGGVAAVLGFLGQWIGYYKVARVVLRDGPRLGVSPAAVIRGFGESLVTAVVGLAILIAAAVLWYLLRLRWSSLARRRVRS